MSAKSALSLDEYLHTSFPDLYTCDPGLAEVDTLRIPELDVEIQPAQVFVEFAPPSAIPR